MSGLRVPKSLTIRKKKWRIFEEGEEPKRLRRRTSMESRGVLGVCFVEARVIVLAKGLKPEEQDSALAHEIGHALISGRKVLSDEAEERLLRDIDEALASVIRQLVAAQKP